MSEDLDIRNVREALHEHYPGPADCQDNAAFCFERIARRLNPMVSHAQQDEFKALCDPLIKWLNDNFHPHVSVIVTPTSAELSSGETAYTTEAFLRD